MRKYPTQEDCQLLIDLFNRPYVYSGGCSDEFIKLADKVNKVYPRNFNTLWKKCFGEKSPWNVRVKFSKNGLTKRELYWDKEKAEKLGL